MQTQMREAQNDGIRERPFIVLEEKSLIALMDDNQALSQGIRPHEQGFGVWQA
jgi:hypothetical protein